MESFDRPINQEAESKKLYIERNDPALITIRMNEDLERELKSMNFSKRMYFEDISAHLQQELEKSTGQSLEFTPTESSLEIKPIKATYQFSENDINVINELLNK